VIFRIYGGGMFRGATFTGALRDFCRRELRISPADTKEALAEVVRHYIEQEGLQFPAPTGDLEEDAKRIVLQLLFSGLIEAEEVMA